MISIPDTVSLSATDVAAILQKIQTNTMNKENKNQLRLLRLSGTDYIKLCLEIALNNMCGQRELAIKEINDQLTITSAKYLREMRERYSSNNNIPTRNQLIEYSNVLIHDDILSEDGSNMIGNLYGICPVNTINVIKTLLTEIEENGEKEPKYVKNYFKVMKAILNLPYNSELKKIPGSEIYERFASNCLSIINDWPLNEATEQAKVSAFDLMSSFASVWPDFFSSDAVNILTDLCLVSIGLGNTEIFNSAINLLQTFSKSYYPSFSLVFDSIFDVLYQFISPEADRSSLPDKLIKVTYDFFSQLAKFETELDETPELLASYKFTSNGLIKRKVTELFFSILYSIENIDTSDTGIEDIDNSTPSMHASNLLNLMFNNVKSRELLSLVVENFIKNSTNGTEWHQNHAALMLFLSLDSNQTNFGNSLRDSIFNFVQNNINTVISYLDHNILKVRESALYVLQQTIEYHPRIFNNFSRISLIRSILSKFIPVDEMLPRFPIEQESNEIILLRSFNVLFDIFSHSIIPDSYYNKILSLFTAVIPKTEIAATQAHKAVFEALYVYVVRSMNEESREVILREIYEVLPSIERKDLIGPLLRLVSFILMKRASRVSDIEELHLDLILSMLDLGAYDGGLAAILFSLRTANRDIISGEKVERILSHVDRALDLDARSALYFIAGCCKVGPKIMAHQFSHLFQSTLDVAEDRGQSLGVRAEAVKASGSVLVFLGANESAETVDPMAARFYSILEYHRDSECCAMAPRERLQEEDEMLGALAAGFAAYSKRYFRRDLSVEEQRKLLNDISLLSKKIVNFKKVSADTLIEACQMYSSYCDNCLRRVNILINNHCNHKVVQMALLMPTASNIARATENKMLHT